MKKELAYILHRIEDALNWLAFKIYTNEQREKDVLKEIFGKSHPSPIKEKHE